MLVVWISFGVNIILFASKLWAGHVTDSLALRADGWHTLSDCISTIIVMAGMQWSMKPADKEHPFGHGRAETVAAIFVGFEAAKGDVVITMDADLQDSPDEIPGLYKMITEENYDLISGWKKKRYDPVLSKNIPGKLFNCSLALIKAVRCCSFPGCFNHTITTWVICLFSSANA